METLFIYLIKSSGLLATFYLAYIILLRKETFFNSNRWFLLAGLVSSVVLPLIVFTKIIWVDPTPDTFDWSKIPITTPNDNEALEINWYLVFAGAYTLGIVVFLMKFVFDFYSLSNVLKGKTIQYQADFKFIDVQENIAPFSYFNCIVYNSSLYNTTELENILEHEKVHSTQNHTVDVLISRLFCIVFWFNPMVWFYKKAIVQNLEYIADNEAFKNISDKKAYQLTLLKITTQENCVAITNHFYQSLIKKRIVMLNKNQSNKRNSWKYCVVLPLLGAFVFFFQVKVIAQERNSELTVVEQSKPVENSVDVYKISKSTTDTELKENSKFLKEKYDISLDFSNVERNSKNELTSIKVKLKKGKEIAKEMATKGLDAIKTFGIIISKDENGLLTVDFSTEDSVIKQKSILILPNAPSVLVDKPLIIIDGKKINLTLDELNKFDVNLIQSTSVLKGTKALEKYGEEGKNGVVEIITKESLDNDYYVNDKKVDKTEILLLNQNTIESMNVNKNDKTIRITTKTIHQSTDNIDIPTPPTPPTPPTFTLKTPKSPVFPKAPKAPKGNQINGDKKAWKDYENKMEDFNKKMEAMEPEMKVFEKQMEDFDKQMEPFNVEMEAFEKKMKIYESQMEKYDAKMKAEIKK